ncbi:MAG TPA: right-handed parallel beta-helix repeat-containing protein [Thermoanaerobaculia bacterium]|nr:right-handed parallel beta-helix repeat-containing protein [Thermoanaerobaculia bacterium]
MSMRRLLCLAALLCAALPTFAATFVVTNTLDAGAGSLRQALLDANVSNGTDHVTFAIAAASKTITLSTELPVITDSIVIDGTTQPGYAGAPVVELDGSQLTDAVVQFGLILEAPDSVIRGLVINSFNRGECCITSSAAIYVRKGGHNTIAGNYIGTDVTGTQARGNDIGIIVESGGNTIGGATAADRNVISGNDYDAVYMPYRQGSDGGNRVIGNYLDVDATGEAALHGAFSNFTVNAGAPKTIVANNLAHGGPVLFGESSVARDNVIGRSATGAPLPDGFGMVLGGRDVLAEGNFVGHGWGEGIIVQDGDGIVVRNNVLLDTQNAAIVLVSGQKRGSNGSRNNEIANNTIVDAGQRGGGDGIRVIVSDLRNDRATLRGNRITHSYDLAIDLGDDGVTLNDANDADEGANALQNFPVITSATATSVTATLSSRHSSSFVIELFKGEACGDAAASLGTYVVRTDRNGNAQLSASLADPLVAGQSVSATATDSVGNTSELSACFIVP